MPIMTPEDEKKRNRELLFRQYMASYGAAPQGPTNSTINNLLSQYTPVTATPQYAIQPLANPSASLPVVVGLGTDEDFQGSMAERRDAQGYLKGMRAMQQGAMQNNLDMQRLSKEQQMDIMSQNKFTNSMTRADAVRQEVLADAAQRRQLDQQRKSDYLDKVGKQMGPQAMLYEMKKVDPERYNLYMAQFAEVNNSLLGQGKSISDLGIPERNQALDKGLAQYQAIKTILDQDPNAPGAQKLYKSIVNVMADADPSFPKEFNETTKEKLRARQMITEQYFKHAQSQPMEEGAGAQQPQAAAGRQGRPGMAYNPVTQEMMQVPSIQAQNADLERQGYQLQDISDPTKGTKPLTEAEKTRRDAMQLGGTAIKDAIQGLVDENGQWNAKAKEGLSRQIFANDYLPGNIDFYAPNFVRRATTDEARTTEDNLRDAIRYDAIASGLTREVADQKVTQNYYGMLPQQDESPAAWLTRMQDTEQRFNPNMTAETLETVRRRQDMTKKGQKK